ncbi:MAG TPA: mechanosensitive ion channel family protein [Ignavibacteriaceae bacterium]|nr:mechanosensitive ion channel family protein [Ignavibacteriaceae bacterium]
MNYLADLLRNFLQDELLYRLVLVAITISLAFLISILLGFLAKKIIKPFVASTETEYDDKLLEVSGSGLYRIAFIGGIFIALDFFDRGIRSESKLLSKPLIEIYPFLSTVLIILDAILFIVFIYIIINILFKVVTISVEWYAEKVNAKDDRNLSGSLFPLLQKVAKILLFALGVVVILSKFKVDISAFVVSLGVGSLAIALAAQDTLSNMISGFIIMIDRPFRIGDRIRYADNQVGDVIEIGIRSTKIQDFDNNISIIPNNELVKSRLVNVTYPTTLTRVVVEVGVAYGSDINKVKQIMLSATENDTDLSSQKPPDVFFINFGDSSLDFRLIAFTDHYSNVWGMQCRLREKIYELFNKEGIEIPFPQRVVHYADKKQSKE